VEGAEVLHSELLLEVVVIPRRRYMLEAVRIMSSM
jgi:hypothetical protein